MWWHDGLQHDRPHPFTTLAGETQKKEEFNHHSSNPGERLLKTPKPVSSTHTSPSASSTHLPPRSALGLGVSLGGDHFFKDF